MGSAQSYVSPEAALTTAVVVGAIALGYTQYSPTPTSASPPPTEASSASKKANKKKKKQVSSQPTSDLTADTPQSVKPIVVPFPAVLPGEFEPTSSSVPEKEPTPKPKKSKKRKTKNVSDSVVASSIGDRSESSAGAGDPPAKPKRQNSGQPQRTTKESTISIDTDGSWTRVASRRTDVSSSGEGPADPSADPGTSDAGPATSATGNSSPVEDRMEDGIPTPSAAEHRRTLAEKLLPKPRKTGVEDMLETSDYGSVSRVMPVTPSVDEKPASGFSWGDYEDVEENEADGEDDGWGVVKGKSRAKPDRPVSSQTVTRSQKSVDDQTKRQRQNANKRDAHKAAKAHAEAERLATLAKHKRELERANMASQLSKSGSVKKVSGGMSASVDENGKLIWE